MKPHTVHHLFLYDLPWFPNLIQCPCYWSIFKASESLVFNFVLQNSTVLPTTLYCKDYRAKLEWWPAGRNGKRGKQVLFCLHLIVKCKQASIIQRYTCLIDVWYNLYFATHTKVKQRRFWTNAAYFLIKNILTFSTFLKYCSGVAVVACLLLLTKYVIFFVVAFFKIIDWLASVRLFMFAIADQATIKLSLQ